MEKIYPVLVKPEWEKELIDMAKKKAMSLNLPLLRQATGEQGEQARYPNPIESLGSPAPFEYVDANGDVQLEGRFTIQEAYELYSPCT